MRGGAHEGQQEGQKRRGHSHHHHQRDHGSRSESIQQQPDEKSVMAAPQVIDYPAMTVFTRATERASWKLASKHLHFCNRQLRLREGLTSSLGYLFSYAAALKLRDCLLQVEIAIGFGVAVRRCIFPPLHFTASRFRSIAHPSLRRQQCGTRT